MGEKNFYVQAGEEYGKKLSLINGNGPLGQFVFASFNQLGHICDTGIHTFQFRDHVYTKIKTASIRYALVSA